MSKAINSRKSNFELLRIISMLMIIAYHYALYARTATASVLDTFNGLWFQSFRIEGKLGVTLFVMISGYFLVTSERMRISKLIRFVLQVLFYSITLFIVMSAVKGEFDLSYASLKAVFLPISHDTWWFATTYFWLFLLSPFLNRMIRNLSREGYLAMLGILFVMVYVVPTLLLQSMRIKELVWFIFVYCLAGYIRLHGITLFRRTGSAFIAAGFAYLANFWLRVLFLELGKDNELFQDHSAAFCDYNGIPILITALLIFLAFEKLDIGSIKPVNVIASASFGVYLIHDHPAVREWLTQNIFSKVPVRDPGFFPYTLAVVLGIFTVCTAAELIRINLLERYYMRFFTKHEDQMYGAVRRALTRTAEKLKGKSQS